VKRLTLYTKPQCGLCDEVKDVIDEARARIAFELDVRNILEDAADYDRYKHDIPVVLLNGREIARHRMTLPQLLAALHDPTV
jgi:glutaredoxin